MADYRISPDQLGDTLDKIFKEYGTDVVGKAISTETKKSMRRLVKETKATAPIGKRSKHYRDSISSKVEYNKRAAYGVSYGEVWYVKGSDYRLSHLLEHGHVKRNGGRTHAFKFIGTAYEGVEREYLERLKEAIERG